MGLDLFVGSMGVAVFIDSVNWKGHRISVSSAAARGGVLAGVKMTTATQAIASAVHAISTRSLRRSVKIGPPPWMKSVPTANDTRACCSPIRLLDAADRRLIVKKP